jgi:hypothetical protein
LPAAVALGFLTLYLLVSKRLRSVVRAERLTD